MAHGVGRNMRIMIIPVGSQNGAQKLLQITRQTTADGEEFVRTELDPVRFVPFLGGSIRK